jgi:hypothetical protein
MDAGTRSFGMTASLAAAVASIAYDIPQLLQVAGVLRDPWDRILIFAPSLLLAPSFVCAMAAAVELASPARRAIARAAFGLSIMYAVLVSTVYVIQLAVVIPRELHGEAAQVAWLTCCSPQMPLTGLDLLGYSVMSVALWLLAAALGEAHGKLLQRVLRVNGWLVFVILGQLRWPWLIWPAAVWLASFPLAMLLLRRCYAPGKAAES